MADQVLIEKQKIPAGRSCCLSMAEAFEKSSPGGKIAAQISLQNRLVVIGTANRWIWRAKRA